jgi:hypothetical protein
MGLVYMALEVLEVENNLSANASAKSDARFREYVKAGRVLCARSI